MAIRQTKGVRQIRVGLGLIDQRCVYQIGLHCMHGIVGAAQSRKNNVAQGKPNHQKAQGPRAAQSIEQ